MKKLLMIAWLPLVGCMNLQPIGPFADEMARKKIAAEEPVPEPVVRQAGKPVPPSLMVTPAEITAANAAEAARRLQQELETDRRALEAMPKYSEVSRPK
jgi:hypothetical protein